MPTEHGGRIERKIANEQAALAAQGEVAAIDVQGSALRAIEKWDGKLPQVSGVGATPFVDLKPAG